MNANPRSPLQAGASADDRPSAEPAPAAEERLFDLEQLGSFPLGPRPQKPEGVVLGVLAALDAGGPLVDFMGNPQAGPIAARATVAFQSGDVGRTVALLFENGDWNRPLILGLVQEPPPVVVAPDSVEQALDLPGAEVEVDGKRLVLTGQEQIVLRCGAASITLTKAGKIILRGTYVLSRSEGMNNIQGATVHIN